MFYWANLAWRARQIYSYYISDHFDVTPDLEYIINSPEWDSEITKFSIRVKEAFAQKKMKEENHNE